MIRITQFYDLYMDALQFHPDDDNVYHIGPDEMKGSDEVIQKMLEELEGKERKVEWQND